MKENEDDEIDDSDLLLPFVNIKSTGEVNQNSSFSRLFLPFNTIDGGGPGNQLTLTLTHTTISTVAWMSTNFN